MSKMDSEKTTQNEEKLEQFVAWLRQLLYKQISLCDQQILFYQFWLFSRIIPSNKIRN